MISLRRPAPAEFLLRRQEMVDWKKWGRSAPAVGSMGWLVGICRAEIDWAEAEWRRLGGNPFDLPRPGPHPAERLRLPHEQAAARLLNCHGHVTGPTSRFGEAGRRLRAQRKAARDMTQAPAWRAHWARLAIETGEELATHRARRVTAWRAFLEAATHYALLRHRLESAQPVVPEPRRAAA